MKHSILLFAIMVLSTTVFLTNCTSSSDKVDAEQEKVLDAQKELADAEEKYDAEIKAYKEENNRKIEANKKSIAEFNEKIKNDKQSAKEDYIERVAELDQQNSDLKVKLDEYVATGKDNWETFKFEYNRDMRKLGLAMGETYRIITE